MSEEYIKKEDAIKAFEKSLLGKYILWDTQDKIKKDMQERISQLPTYSIPDSAENKRGLISKQAVINAIANTCFWLSADNWEELTECINSIPSVENKENDTWT